MDICRSFYVILGHFCILSANLTDLNTVKPVLAITSVKQPTCLKQPIKMFPNVHFVLIVTSIKQPPALSRHFLCFPCVAAKHRFDCKFNLKSKYHLHLISTVTNTCDHKKTRYRFPFIF